ncbi:MAG: cobalamin-dependent protein [Clostridiales bacterium]
MKVLLVRPQAPNLLSFTKILDNEPLDLEYLYTALKEKGITSVIFDGLISNDFEETLERERPDVLSVTGYITQQNLMIRFCELAKKYNPQTATIVGGVHAQLNYKSFYCDWVDYVFRSESPVDYAGLVSLVGGGRAKGGPGLDDINELGGINGLCYRVKGEYRENPLSPVDINSLPIPDRSFFYGNRQHFRYLELTEVASIKTAFSCPYDCNFCYCTLLGGGSYQPRDLDLVIEELAGIDAANIQIVDDDFLVDPKRLWRFIGLVKEKQIKKTYICYARADFICENPDIVRALAEIGFRYFLVGLEAVTDAELAGMNKKTSVDMNRRCLEIIGETTAQCIGLMIAPLDADKAYFENLYNWIVKAGLQYVTVSIFTPIPGTPLYEEYKNRITSTDIVDWDFLHLVVEPAKLSRREFYREYRRLFLRLYKIARKAGIYDFMDLAFYRNMLMDYLTRKIGGR